MWLVTTCGFFSVVCAREGEGEPGAAVDPSRVVVRARSPAHLQALKERLRVQLAGCDVVATPDADYGWRILCPKAVRAECVKELSLEMAYDNFKDACAKRHGPASGYLDVLHQTWELFGQLREP
jgi:hypothetical protein